MFRKKQDTATPQYEKFDTLIGQSTSVEGVIRTEDPFRIDGNLKGDVISTGDLVLGEQGRIIGNVTCQNMLLAGTVEGNVNTSGQLHITAKGQLRGDAQIQTLIIDELGIFDGTCEMIKETTPTEKSPQNTNQD